ncbi:MAG: hypothetical protein KKD35_03195 [Elusimicrobia bacterium]|nr:hypothetical protein [Elusimicrobiota bacterium]
MAKVKHNNGMRHPGTIKENAQRLRKSGLTHREIARQLKISIGSAFLWTKEICLSEKQKEAIHKRKCQAMYTPQLRKKLSKMAKKNLSKFWKKPYTSKELINKIQDFYKQNGRIPLKREFNAYATYGRHFGSWNDAIIKAGFKPNEVIFSKKFIANDGHTCDSFTEKIIDDWLFKNKIPHERHIKYRGTRMTADFVVRDIIIEYFGLAGQSKHYDYLIQEKREYCRKRNIKLIELYPSRLFSKEFQKSLDIILKEIK